MTHASPTYPILLAPAGSLPAVEAALSAGADAVYVGVRSLSRGGRTGLSPESVGAAVSACRRAGARLHAAINAVPSSGELADFLTSLHRLRDAGIDEVILNDPGVIALARREFPGLPLCASVGLSVLNPEDARAYRDLGADAVVLPSAVRPGEIPLIKKASGLRIEVFAYCRPEFLLHGKCGLTGYAVEGNGGGTASAKRGGSCRLVCRNLPVPAAAHSLEDELPVWIEAGADVFKIEGRELSPPAVSALVTRFRRKLDAGRAASAGR
jgi:putative protease